MLFNYRLIIERLFFFLKVFNQTEDNKEILI